MKIITWNVNGYRACMKKGFYDFFSSVKADVFCPQEIKTGDAQPGFIPEGYHCFWNPAEKKGYAGTGVFSKDKPLSVSFGMGEAYQDEGRVMTLDFKDYVLVNCYAPHSQRNLERIEYKKEFDDCLIQYMSDRTREKPVILCGDLNVAHQDIDLKNDRANRGNAGFTSVEREAFSRLLSSGFTDSYRYKYPDRQGAYTWWSYRSGVRERNIGWRIDYILVSDCLKNDIEDCYIYSAVYGSDHCPAGIDMKL